MPRSYTLTQQRAPFGTADARSVTVNFDRVVNSGSGAEVELPWVEATGLSATDGAANRTALQAQWDAAVADGNSLRLPRRTGGGQWPISPIDQNSGRWWCLQPLAGYYCGFDFAPGAGLKFADGTVTDARTQNSIFRIVSHEEGGHIRGVGGRGYLSGNTAGQSGYTIAQNVGAQGQACDLIAFDGIDGGSCVGWSVRQLWLGDTFNHCVNTIGETHSGDTDKHFDLLFEDLIGDKFGEGIQVSDATRLAFRRITLIPYLNWTYGDVLEPTYCRKGVIYDYLCYPGDGEATANTAGSLIDFYGSQDFDCSLIKGYGVSQGFDFNTNDARPCTRVTIDGFQIYGSRDSFFGVPAQGGRVKLSRGYCYGGTQQENYSLRMQSGTTGVADVSDVEFAEVNAMEVGSGAKGTVNFTKCRWVGTRSGNDRFADWHPGGVGNTATMTFDACSIESGPEYGFRFTASGTLPSGAITIRNANDFGGIEKLVQFQSGAVDLSAAVVAGSLYGETEAAKFIDDTSSNPVPLFGASRVKAASGSYLTDFGSAADDQAVELRFTGTGTLVHGTGDIRLSGAANFTGHAGEILTFRRVAGAWWERSRSGTGAATTFQGTVLADYAPGPLWCYTDAGATTRCGDGDLIYTQLDLSGNSRHRVQSNSSVRPVLRRDANGLWYVDFGTGALRYFTCTVDPVYVAEMAWAGRSTNAVWNYGGFINPTGGRWQLTDSGTTAWLPDPVLTTVIKNGVALSSPFDCGPITSNMVLQVVSANQVLTPTGWQFNTAESNQYAWEKREYRHVLFGATQSAPQRADTLAKLQATYA